MRQGKMRFLLLLFFLISFLSITTVNAYTIICTDEIKGVQIWNLEQTFNETGWTLEDIGNEEGLNCTLVETSVTLREDCQEFEPIIAVLNQNLRDNHEEINSLEKRLVRYNYYKLFSLIFLATTIVLTIFLQINFKENNKYSNKLLKQEV